MPKISVVIPVYNAEPYLQEAMDSIVNQTFRDLEIICINDSSTDNSPAILESYAKQDSRVVILQNEVNLGIVDTLNKGLAAASGEFIARMDSDDIAELNRFQIQLDFMNLHPEIGICGSEVTKFGKVNRRVKLPISSEEIRAALFFNCCLMHPTVLMRADLLKKYNLKYDRTCNNSEDFELWTRCAEFFDLANIPRSLLKYRVHEKSISSSKEQEQKQKTLKIIKKQFERCFSLEFDEDKLLLLFDSKDLNEKTYVDFEDICNRLIDLNKKHKAAEEKLFNHYLKKVASKALKKKFKETKQIFYLQKMFRFNKMQATMMFVANFWRVRA